MVCSGITLDAYADPVKRAAWKAKARIRTGGRKARMDELLLRNGLHPSQRKVA